MPKDRRSGGLERWAELRFSIIGPLLASPPPRGELAAELARLADREWLHPKSRIGANHFSGSVADAACLPG